jgi:hypothetical protein
MKQNTTIPSVTEKFCKQRQRMQKIMVAFVSAIALMVSVPLVLRLFPALRNHSAWNGMGTAWICLFGIICVALGIAAMLNQMCPACGKPLGELFWTTRFCPHCGIQLSED